MADRRLQVFHTVAKQLSFTKAAEVEAEAGAAVAADAAAGRLAVGLAGTARSQNESDPA